MNKQEFAQLLNGREYGNEITKEEEQLAKENDLIVVFGYSDDNLEFRGLIYDELGAFDGCNAFIVKKKGGKIDVISEYDLGQVQEVISNKELEFQLPKVKVSAEWSPQDVDCSWKISTEIPHETFNIYEDGDLYCVGIVISKEDVLINLK